MITLFITFINQRKSFLKLEVDEDECKYLYMKNRLHFELIQKNEKIEVFQDKNKVVVIKLKERKPHLIIPRKENILIDELKDFINDLISNDMLP